MNDMKQALNGILPNVLKVRRKTTSKSPNAVAVFMDKFEGRMHPEKIILAGKTFGHFSYCYLGTQSCTQVWEYMREARIMAIRSAMATFEFRCTWRTTAISCP